MSPADPLGMSTSSIPILADNGSNWMTYKSKVLATIRVQGLRAHLDGHAQKPLEVVYAADGSGTLLDGKTLTEDEIEEYEDRMDTYIQQDAMAKEVVYSTILD